jgi:hypothetical protein
VRKVAEIPARDSLDIGEVSSFVAGEPWFDDAVLDGLTDIDEQCAGAHDGRDDRHDEHAVHEKQSDHAHTLEGT